MEVGSRTVVVTGASSGIGRAAAVALADKGARLVLLDVADASDTWAAMAGEGHRFVQVDVANPGEMTGLFNALASEQVDLAGVVNSAGIVTGGKPWPHSDLSRMSAVVNVNAAGTAIATTLAARYPLPGERCVVNVSSVAALRPHPPDPTYALTKAGVLAFTRSAALCPDLRVNAVLPGVVRTSMLDTTGVGGPADWVKGRLDGALLEAGQIADVILRLMVENHDAQAWTVGLDPDDPTRVRVENV